MTPAAGSDYLQTEVLTATPQKLQLMLIEAALRATSQARHHFVAQNFEGAFSLVLRAQTIVAQLLAGLQPDPEDDLSGRVAGVYLFINRSLVAANLDRNIARLDDALRVLEVERETWREVCQLLGSRIHSEALTTSLLTTSLAGASFEA